MSIVFFFFFWWLNEIQDAVYHAEDLVDEICTKALPRDLRDLNPNGIGFVILVDFF